MGSAGLKEMAGHSHWANIKHKKAANDAKKTKVITQMGRLIRGAIQVGGLTPIPILVYAWPSPKPKRKI